MTVNAITITPDDRLAIVTARSGRDWLAVDDTGTQLTLGRLDLVGTLTSAQAAAAIALWQVPAPVPQPVRSVVQGPSSRPGTFNFRQLVRKVERDGL